MNRKPWFLSMEWSVIGMSPWSTIWVVRDLLASGTGTFLSRGNSAPCRLWKKVLLYFYVMQYRQWWNSCIVHGCCNCVSDLFVPFEIILQVFSKVIKTSTRTLVPGKQVSYSFRPCLSCGWRLLIMAYPFSWYTLLILFIYFIGRVTDMSRMFLWVS